jgi:hypothetical protein
VEHNNSRGESIALQIEVTRIPDILLTQLEELTASFERLEADLASDFTGSETTEPGGRDG